MCLFNPQRVNNSEGIIAYKVVKRQEKDRNFFRAIVTDAPYSVGKSYVSLVNRSRELDGEIRIREAIHLFTSLEVAIEAVQLYKKYRMNGKTGYISIVKCYIPKNALIFKGEDSFGNLAYATNRIRILKVIEEYKLM